MRRSARVPIVVALVAAVLRLGWLGSDSLWLDEAFSIRLALQHPYADIWAGTIDPVHPPLFYVILKCAVSVLGVSEWTGRLASAVASLLNIGLVYVLARNLALSPRAAGIAAALMAVSPLEVWYAQEARMYALVTCAGLLFVVGSTVRSWAGVPLAAIGLVGGMHLDFTMMPLVSGLLAVWFAWWWHGGRSLPALSRMTIAVGTAVWLSGPLWPQLRRVVDTLNHVTFFAKAERVTGLGPLQPHQFGALLVFLSVAIAVAAFVFVRMLRDERFGAWSSWTVWIGFIAATAALTVPRAYSLKQILVTGWPYVVLAAAWALTDAVGPRPAADRIGRLRLPMTIAASFIAAVLTLITPRADWRGVAGYIDRQAPADTVVIDPPYNAIPYDFYKPSHPAVAAPPEGGSAGDIWLIAERFGASPPTSPTEARLDAERALIDAIPFARLELRRYGQPIDRR